MTSETGRLDTLLHALLNERADGAAMELPQTLEGKRRLLRALMNTRPPEPLSADLLALQDEVLQRQREEKGVADLDGIPPSPRSPRLRLWQGDITRLRVDAIVNAANAGLLGCFTPLHNCIDNAIHSAAGMQLREECHSLILRQGHEEPTGKAKITRGYNLPASWVIHTVGPIVHGPQPTATDCRLLADCYRNCLELADKHRLGSIAFCCISTGVFRFPHAKAAEIAVATVQAYLRAEASGLGAVVFNVFRDDDRELYTDLLGYR